MYDAFKVIADSLGFSIDTILVLIFLIGGIVFYIKDFKIGTLINFVIQGSLFMWFVAADMNWGLPLTLMFIFLIVLSLSMYSINRSANAGGFT